MILLLSLLLAARSPKVFFLRPLSEKNPAAVVVGKKERKENHPFICTPPPPVSQDLATIAPPVNATYPPPRPPFNPSPAYCTSTSLLKQSHTMNHYPCSVICRLAKICKLSKARFLPQSTVLGAGRKISNTPKWLTRKKSSKTGEVTKWCVRSLYACPLY